MFVHHGPIDDHDVPGAPFALLVARMRTRLAEADLDCRCRDEIENRLSRLEDDNAREEIELALVQARAFHAMSHATGPLRIAEAIFDDIGSFASSKIEEADSQMSSDRQIRAAQPDPPG
jgi:hypothetical protein